MKVARVSRKFSPDRLRRVIDAFRGWGYKVIPAELSDPNNRVTAEVFPTNDAYRMTHVVKILAAGIVPVVGVDNYEPLPAVNGYSWKKLGDGLFYPHAEKTRPMQETSDPGDWRFPLPSLDLATGKPLHWARCYVKVRNLRSLPVWLLNDPDLVFLDGDAAKSLMRPQELFPKGKPVVLSRVPLKIRGVQVTGSGVRSRLTGLEVLERAPEDASYMMSVMGWPLSCIPIQYLVHYAGGGDLKRRVPRDGSQSGWDEVWVPVDNYAVRTVRPRLSWNALRHEWEAQILDERLPATAYLASHCDRMSPYGDLLKHVKRYLDSGEGRLKMRQAGLLLEKGEAVACEDEFACSDFWGHGVFVRRQQSVSSQEQIRFDLFKDDTRLVAGRVEQTVYESFSTSDKDRFGPWGSSPRPLWINTGRVRSKLDRYEASRNAGDDDPSPSYSLEFRSKGDSEHWVDSLPEEEYRDWSPPTAVFSCNEDEAWRRAWNLYNRLQTLETLWKERHDDFQFDHTRGILNPRDRFALIQDQEEELDHLEILRLEWFYQLQPVLDPDDRLIAQVEDQFSSTHAAVAGNCQEPDPEPALPSEAPSVPATAPDPEVATRRRLRCQKALEAILSDLERSPRYPWWVKTTVSGYGWVKVYGPGELVA